MFYRGILHGKMSMSGGPGGGNSICYNVDLLLSDYVGYTESPNCSGFNINHEIE